MKAHVTRGYRYATIPEWLLYDSSVSALAIRVYGVLDRHGSDPSNCYPGHTRIAKLVGVSPRSINAPIRELEQVGAVLREKRESADGGRTSNGYYLAGDHPFDRAAERALRAAERVPHALSSALNESNSKTPTYISTDTQDAGDPLSRNPFQ